MALALAGADASVSFTIRGVTQASAQPWAKKPVQAFKPSWGIVSSLTCLCSGRQQQHFPSFSLRHNSKCPKGEIKSKKNTGNWGQQKCPFLFWTSWWLRFSSHSHHTICMSSSGPQSALINLLRVFRQLHVIICVFFSDEHPLLIQAHPWDHQGNKNACWLV